MRALLAAISMVAIVMVAACEQPPAPQKDSPAAAASTAAPMKECPGEAAGHECSEVPKAADNQTHFGQAFQLEKSEALSAVAPRASDAGEKVKITGTVDAVCQKKGCWMILRDGDTTARVFTHAGDFFLPIGTSKGRKAIVEGELKARDIDKKFAQHLEEDRGGDPTKVEGPTRELVVEATSLSLL